MSTIQSYNNVISIVKSNNRKILKICFFENDAIVLFKEENYFMLAFVVNNKLEIERKMNQSQMIEELTTRVINACKAKSHTSVVYTQIFKAFMKHFF